MSEPCEYKEVILRLVDVQGETRGIVAGMAGDISEIKARVNTGLANEIAQIGKDLAKSISNGTAKAIEIKSEAKAEATAVASEVALSAEKLRGENWLGRIVTGSVSKLIGIGVAAIILSALANSAVALFVKEKYSLETPGQQREILRQQGTIQSTLNVPHVHVLPDGNVLSHTGDPNTPAWMLNTKTNTWEKAPTMRTEGNIK